MDSNVLVGRFVTLRLIAESDAEITFRWRNLERAKFLGGAPNDVEQQVSWIKGRPENEFNYVIESNHSSKRVGMLSLLDVDLKNSNAQSGRFLIGEESEVAGFPVAAEAMLLLHRFAFYDLDLNRVYGFIASTNLQMIRWQKYFGMVVEGTWREHLMLAGTPTDAVLMGMLKNEFRTFGEARLQAMVKMGNS